MDRENIEVIIEYIEKVPGIFPDKPFIYYNKDEPCYISENDETRIYYKFIFQYIGIDSNNMFNIEIVFYMKDSDKSKIFFVDDDKSESVEIFRKLKDLYSGKSDKKVEIDEILFEKDYIYVDIGDNNSRNYNFTIKLNRELKESLYEQFVECEFTIELCESAVDDTSSV